MARLAAGPSTLPGLVANLGQALRIEIYSVNLGSAGGCRNGVRECEHLAATARKNATDLAGSSH
jgi:hypothetical protein